MRQRRARSVTGSHSQRPSSVTSHIANTRSRDLGTTGGFGTLKHSLSFSDLAALGSVHGRQFIEALPVVRQGALQSDGFGEDVFALGSEGFEVFAGFVGFAVVGCHAYHPIASRIAADAGALTGVLPASTPDTALLLRGFPYLLPLASPANST